MTSFVFVFAVTALCAIAQTVTGFGFAVVMMALLPLAMPHEIGLYLSIGCGTAMCFWLIWKYRSAIQWKLALFPAVFSALGVIAGLFLGGKINGSGYMRLLGGFLVLLSIWFLVLAKRIRLPGTPLVGAIAGIIGGIFNALFSIGGPPLVLFYNSVLDEKESYMATLNLSLAISSIVTLVLRFITLDIPDGLLACLPPTVLAVFFGGWIGKKIFSRVNAEQLKRIIYVFMCVVGIYFIITG